MSTSAARSKPIRNVADTTRPRRPFSYRVEFLLGVLMILATALLFQHYVLSSGQFTVQRVLFEGAYMVREEDALAAANITSEDNILFLDNKAIAANVEALPYVKRCEVQRKYPNEVLLRIVERKAVASIMVNNHVFEIDREFVVLRELSPFTPHTGPLLTNLPDIVFAEPGMTLDDNKALTHALALWEVFQTLPFARELTLSELSAEHENQLRMFFNELPYEMRWGRSDFETQAARLAILWQEMGGEVPCAQYLDLRFDADLVCK